MKGKINMKKDQGKKLFKLHARRRDAKGERGAALALVLILMATSLAFTAGLIYMVTSATQVTGGQKRFETALDAGRGGIDVTRMMIGTRGNPNMALDNFSLTAQNVGGVDCLTNKLNNPTASWNAACDSTLTITTGTPASYDMSFDLGTSATSLNRYTVYSKIVDTVNGNSGPSSGLVKTGVVLSNSGQITVVKVPYLYTVEMLSQNAVNPLERARVSALYEY